ncbi:hypothetical protein [Mesorhizobium sp. CAU 1741]|uniref:hypothetical protein n=1 Tax=Mesorhizobium sp. CAU 1741 TaxID=3140366 RepID=UPI00325BA2FA
MLLRRPLKIKGLQKSGARQRPLFWLAFRCDCPTYRQLGGQREAKATVLTKDHPFKIEQWRADESEKVEDLASAATLSIILGAWHVAVRTTPDALLILRNSGHVMERMVTPGKAPAPVTTTVGKTEAPFSAQLDDLRSFHVLRAFCPACMHSKYIEPQPFIDRFGRKAELAAIEKKMRCSKCDGDAVRLEIHTRSR